MAPAHSRREKPPTICFMNLTISGVPLGGVSVLGPSRTRISAALARVRPCQEGKQPLITTHSMSLVTVFYICLAGKVLANGGQGAIKPITQIIGCKWADCSGLILVVIELVVLLCLIRISLVRRQHREETAIRSLETSCSILGSH